MVVIRAFVFATTLLVLGCAAEVTEVPDIDSKSCVIDADCFFDMCTASSCVNGRCQHASRPDGIPCIQYQDELKEHVAGVCFSGSCANCDAGSCECATLPNGWSCDYPEQGVCLDGICVPGE
jgi:hypothetical protein